MEVIETALPGVLLIRTSLFHDHRGSFRETWQADRYAEHGIARTFAQDNAAVSRQGVLRGLHYQLPNPQGKLVGVLTGAVYDVAVDIRRGSATFGQWIAQELSAENGRQLWIPAGFAHGYLALSDTAVLAYKCTTPYRGEAAQAIAWNDPQLAIPWPCTDPVLSDADARAPQLGELPLDALPGLDA